MKPSARWLFGIAGAANLTVGFGLLFWRSWTAPFAGLDLSPGTNLVLIDFAALMIALFGYAYIRIAMDPNRYRPVIHIFAVGKLLAVSCTTIPWLEGTVPARLPLALAPMSSSPFCFSTI